MASYLILYDALDIKLFSGNMHTKTLDERAFELQFDPERFVGNLDTKNFLRLWNTCCDCGDIL